MNNMDLMVRKTDGTTEPFDRNKIKNGVMKAGATEEQAEDLTAQVETWAQEAAVDGVIATSEIRTKGLEILGQLNPEALESYKEYEAQKKQEEAVE
ncbi:hypothetical protein JW978_03160 [Candidatus Dojkabacteria bacterium]|nr:hypothetical protein [Candidatus Dojkabacteria bacterium]